MELRHVRSYSLTKCVVWWVTHSHQWMLAPFYFRVVFLKERKSSLVCHHSQIPEVSFPRALGFGHRAISAQV